MSENEAEEKKKDETKSLFRPHEEITVTATMTRKAVKDCSVAVSIVDTQDLMATTAANALNALSFLPGIFIHRTGDFGRADVEIRGLGQRGQRITILVDGRPEKMGLFGCAVTHAFPLDNVARIEVVRGPASVLYGSDALGGVVNIMTRVPEQGFETDFTSSFGSFNTWQFTLRHGAALGKWHYYLTLDSRTSDGHIENSGYSGKSFTGKVGYDLNDDLSLSFQGKYYQGKKFEPGPLAFPLPDFWNDYERGAFDLSLKGSWDRDEFFLKLYRDFGHHQFSDGWHSRDFVDGAVVRFSTRRLPGNELTIGLDLRRLGGKSYSFPRGNWDRREEAVFVQNEHVFFDRLILAAGLRLNRDSHYGLELCPQAGFVFQVGERSHLRGVLSKGFRSPQINELFMFPTSNPDLKAESVWNYEAGFEQALARGVHLSAAVFVMKGDNLIELFPNPLPPPPFRFSNSGEFTFKGAELSLRADIARGLSSHFHYTYLDPGERTKGKAGQKFDAFLQLATGLARASLGAQYVTDYHAADFSLDRLPSYFFLNGRVDLRLHPSFELFIGLNNLLNADYRIYADLPGIAAGVYSMPGRNIHLGLRIAP